MESGFLGQAYESRSKFLAGERLINLYPVVTDKNVTAFMGCPGFRDYCDTGTSAEVRDFHRTKKGKLYVVAGNKVFKVALGVKTEIGTLHTSSGAVDISSNPTQVLIVDGVSGYVITIATDAFAIQADPDFPYGTTTSLFCETFTLCADPNSDIIQVSAQNDCTNWDALDFTSAESYPDNVSRLGELRREVYSFGTQSVEVFSRDYSGNFAFSRVGNIFIEYGITAPRSLALAADTFVWLGENKEGGNTILALTNYQIAEIGTPATEYAIESYSTTDDAIGFSYRQDSQTFYCLIFPTEGKCWTYSFLAKLWHERNWFVEGEYTRYRPNCHVYHERKHLVGDFANGKIYEMSMDVHDYAGTPRRWNRTWQVPKAENRMVEYANLRLQAEMGVGLDGIGNDTDPQVALRTSRDAGNNWNNEILRPLGKIGETHRTAKWARIGQGRNKAFELTGSNAVKTTLINATIDALILDVPSV